MNCPNCSAPMHLVKQRDYFVCDYCGTFHFPKESAEGIRLLGKDADATCPVCGETLQAATVEGHLVKACPHCRGLLARQRAFAIIVQKRRANYDGPKTQQRPIHDEERHRRVQCPSCGSVMDNHPYLGPGAVLVDTCGQCALVWLDRGEMTIIERA